MIYWSVAFVLLAYFVIWFIISTVKNNYGIVDIAWGLGFVVVGWTSLIVSRQLRLQTTIILLFVSVWGLRLFWHLVKRNWNSPEDYRYVNMRKNWGTTLFHLKAFVNVFVLQGVLLFIMSLSIMHSFTQVTTGLQWW